MGTKRFQATVACASIAFFGASCASTPPETVELSAAIGRDLNEIQTAHQNLVRQHFGHMRARAETFVDEVYRPYIVRTTMEDLDLVNGIQAAARGEGELDPLDLMEIYADEAIGQIEVFRERLLDPIDSQELEVLTRLDSIYGAVRNANAVLTAHLSSVQRVRGEQRELLASAELPEDLGERLARGLADFSDDVDSVLSEAEVADEALEQLPDRIRELRSRF